MNEVEDAIRAWEAARVVEAARTATLDSARVAQEMARRALEPARTREEEARREAVRLMARFPGPMGWIVDGRIYYRANCDDIRSLEIASDTSKGGAR